MELRWMGEAGRFKPSEDEVELHRGRVKSWGVGFKATSIALVFRKREREWSCKSFGMFKEDARFDWDTLKLALRSEFVLLGSQLIIFLKESVT